MLFRSLILLRFRRLKANCISSWPSTAPLNSLTSSCTKRPGRWLPPRCLTQSDRRCALPRPHRADPLSRFAAKPLPGNGTARSRTRPSNASTTMTTTSCADTSPTSSAPTTSGGASRPSRAPRPSSSSANNGQSNRKDSPLTRSIKCRD